MFDPISLLILAGGAFAKMQASEDAADRRESIRRSMEAFQRTKAHEVDAATQDLVEKQTPQARADESGQIVQDRTQSLRDTVGAAQAFNAPPIAGKLSDDYRNVDEANANRVAERTRRSIQNLAEMGAPEEQGQAFGIRFGRAASRVDAANAASKNVGEGYLSDIDRVRPDPTLSAIGEIGLGVGKAMMGGGGGEDAVIDAAANNGQGYEDAAGNLYNEGVTTRQDARIQRQAKMNRIFSLFGG